MSENDERPMKSPDSVFVIKDGLVFGMSENGHKANDLRVKRNHRGGFSEEALSNYHWELRHLRAISRRKGKI